MLHAPTAPLERLARRRRARTSVVEAILTAHSDPEGNARRWLAIALISVLGLVLLTVAVMSKTVLPFDKPLLDQAMSWSAYEGVWNVFSEAGNLPMIPIGLGFVGWLWYKKRHREAILVLLLFALATAGSEGLKALVARPRPQGGGAGIPGVVYSYPSGHSWEDSMILGMVGMNLFRYARARWVPIVFTLLTMVFIAFVCVARVALGVHYPSDMLAGLFGGVGILGLYAWWSRPGGWADHSRLRES